MKYGYIIKCDDLVKDATGNLVELRCTADLDSKSGGPAAGRKVKGTIHWVSAPHAIGAQARLYDRLFTTEDPNGADWKNHLNPDSLTLLTGCKAERSLAGAKAQEKFQFERLGYFCVDLDSTPENLIFNRTVSLRDTWAKIERS